jgi:ABC-2 type transport system permease protein
MKRLISVFRKNLLEQLRSGWELILVLLLGPAFVLIYWLFLGGGSTSYTLLVLNEDRGPHGAQLSAALRDVRYPTGEPILKVVEASGRAQAEQRLRNRDAAALLVLPPDFSARLEGFRSGSQPIAGEPVLISGDLTNPTYSVAAVLGMAVYEDYLRQAAGQPRPVALVEQPLGGSAARTEFETYVPGLLVVAVVMMLFTAAMRVTSEVESGGLKRLALTRVTSLEFLGGVSAVQLLVGLAAVVSTFLAAIALGFRSQGPLGLAILVGGLTAFSVIGVGLIIAGFARTGTEAFIIANFPMVLLMFFSGAVFPMPRAPLFHLAGRPFALFDLLPQTHAVLALNKILTLGAGLREVTYELAMVTLLSILYFAIGVWIFDRRVLRKG